CGKACPGGARFPKERCKRCCPGGGHAPCAQVERGLSGPRGSSAGQMPAALGAEAVARQVVVATGWAYQSPRRLVLKPPIPIAPVPLTVSRTEHPLAALHIPHTYVPDRLTKCPSIDGSAAPLLNQLLIAKLRLTKGIDRHRRQI